MEKIPICSEMEQFLFSLGFKQIEETEDTIKYQFIYPYSPKDSVIAIIMWHGRIVFKHQLGREQKTIVDTIHIEEIEELKFLFRRVSTLQKFEVAD